MHHAVRREHQAHAEAHCRRAGYARGGATHDDAAADRKMIAEAVHKHERHDHPGEPLTKLKTGGAVHGGHAAERLDRRARGGKVGKHHGRTQVNVIVQSGNPAEQQMAAQRGLRVGAALGARAAAGRMAPPAPMPAPGPMAGPPPGGPPPGGMPMAGPGPMPMHARGGEIRVREHVRRRAGGAV